MASVVQVGNTALETTDDSLQRSIIGQNFIPSQINLRRPNPNREPRDKIRLLREEYETFANPKIEDIKRKLSGIIKKNIREKKLKE